MTFNTDYRNQTDRQPTAMDRIVEAWNKNPVGTIMVATAFMHGAAKLIEAVSGIPSKRAYARNATIRAKKGRDYKVK